MPQRNDSPRRTPVPAVLAQARRNTKEKLARFAIHKRHPAVLWILLSAALAFGLLVHFHPQMTGNYQVNGLSGIFLGLFIAAFQAANFLTMLLFEPGERSWRNLRQAYLPGALLNLAVLLAGLVVVVVGTKLFFAHWQPG